MTGSVQDSACEKVIPSLESYFDGQLNGTVIADVELHLERCEACRGRMRVLSALREGLRDHAPAEAPLYLKEAIRAAVGARREEVREEVGVARVRRRLIYLAAAACLMAAVGLGSWIFLADLGGRSSPLDALVEDHVTLVQAVSGADTQTGAPDDLARWFAARLDFAPRVPDWDWAELVSGQLCYIQGRRVARMHYRCGPHDLSVFVQPMEPDLAEAIGHASAPGDAVTVALRGFKVASWKQRDLTYVLVAPEAAKEVFANLSKEE